MASCDSRRTAIAAPHLHFTFRPANCGFQPYCRPHDSQTIFPDDMSTSLTLQDLQPGIAPILREIRLEGKTSSFSTPPFFRDLRDLWGKKAESNLLPRARKRWEPRHPAVGQLLIPKQHGRPNLGRILPLLVGKTGPDRELLPARQTHHQCSKPPLVPSRPRLVRDHDRLVIFEGFDLQKRRRAARGALRLRLPQHHPLA